MRKIVKILSIGLIFFLIAACATVRPMRTTATEPERVLDKNYRLNQLRQVYVGEEILKIKDYWVKKIICHKMEALNDFTVKAPFSTQIGSKGDKYNIFGKSKKRGERRLFN